jgi:hypothetical protein
MCLCGDGKLTQKLWQPDAHKIFSVFKFKPFCLDVLAVRCDFLILRFCTKRLLLQPESCLGRER